MSRTQSADAGVHTDAETSAQRTGVLNPGLVAWHVGRQGEVAGGMTQVVNAYVNWRFEDFELRVIRSRDGSGGPRAWALFAQALRQVFAIGDPSRNMVVVHLSQGGSFVREGLLLLLAHARGLGTVAHLHGSSFVEFAGKRPWLVGKVLAAACKVIVLSEATRSTVERFVPASRVALMPNAVPLGTPVPKERLVVFGGSVSRRKGVDVLAAAWRQVGPGSGWRLAVAGPVVDAGVLPEDLPQADRLGPVAHGELMALLDRASIAVLPSRDEAMPMFILEAMARDNCVIATPVGGIPQVLGGGCGLLVQADDVDALAAALRQAMQDDRLRHDTAAAGRAAFDSGFSAHAVYPRVERLWREVLKRPEPARSQAR